MEEQLQQISFSPEVLAKVAPDVSLKRHLSLGYRPCLRGFNEFRPLQASTGSLQELENQQDQMIIGSAVGKCGETTVICGITCGVIEESDKAEFSSEIQDVFESVFPVVDVARGRSGAPTDEEMMLSQKLYEVIFHSKLIPKSALQTRAGILYMDQNSEPKIMYPDDSTDELFEQTKKFSFVLYAHLKVFSRTGSLFDVCYHTLIQALKNTALPRVYIEDSFNSVKIPVRTRGNFGHLQRAKRCIIDSDRSVMEKLKLSNMEAGLPSSFGILEIDKDDGQDAVRKEQIILADLEGEAEEHECFSKITVLPNADTQTLKHVSIIGGGSKVTLDTIKRSINMSKIRSQNV